MSQLEIRVDGHLDNSFKEFDECVEQHTYTVIVGEKDNTSIVMERMVSEAQKNNITPIFLKVPEGWFNEAEEVYKWIEQAVASQTDDVKFLRREFMGAYLDIAENLSKRLPKEKQFLFVVDGIENMAKNKKSGEEFLVATRSVYTARATGKNTNVTFALVGTIPPYEIVPIDSTRTPYNIGRYFHIKSV